jgi:hypothetical protein
VSEELAVIEEPPRRGTLPWLQLQEHVDWHGQQVPTVHRIPEGSERYDGEDDGKCRVVMPERGRCRAARTRLYGICSAHLGGGDPQAAAAAGVAAKIRIKERRQLLGISASRTADPRQAARMAALARVEEIAAAIVDGPLDDENLSTLERQSAVLKAVDATFPLALTTVEIELPANAEGVQDMGWESMVALAAKLELEA